MASIPVASIIRQPHGPSSNGFGAQARPPTSASGPPAADVESTLRRHNTVSTPRHHQASASISSTPAASSAFHGFRSTAGSYRFRSGSLSSSNPDPGLVRKGSGRAVRKEEAVLESFEEGTTETSSWGKGLSRQSSLPSRRAYNPASAALVEPMPNMADGNPPPRPRRRIAIETASRASQMPPASHTASHSMSSLAMFSPPSNVVSLESPTFTAGSGVSRTQSLRAQAKNVDLSGLGRSSSLRTAAEHRPLQPIPSAVSPPSDSTSAFHSLNSPSPPPASSTAALPPYALPHAESQPEHISERSDLRRHQSLTQGYGSSSRVRDRLERSPAVLNLNQREGFRQIGDKAGASDDPPTSPLGNSVWSPSHRGDDGWGSTSTRHIQEAFQTMSIGISTPNEDHAPRGRAQGDTLQQPQPHINVTPTQPANLTDEPSWVAGLVGHADRTSPRPARTASAPGWQDRDAYKSSQIGQPIPSLWGNPPFLAHPFALNQQTLFHLDPRQSGHKSPLQTGGPFMPQFSLYPQQSFNPSYPTPPVTAPLPSEDVNVIELARSKGLNPATFDCRPAQARFFVIKSYTEDDVQKSLKHGIWSSTVLGNKRLDTAFRESAEQMPIFLFFSVNGSRHFCGVAQMLTTVDETQSANVWSENNKWKGIFKVKWIFVRDVPTFALRHIRLLNTPEQKPITNSRDTQELHYEAGCEVLQIFLDHQNKSKTSLLQDFAYYERLSANRPPSAAGTRMGPPSAPPNQTTFINANAPYPQEQLGLMGPPGNGPIQNAPMMSTRYR